MEGVNDRGGIVQKIQSVSLTTNYSFLIISCSCIISIQWLKTTIGNCLDHHFRTHLPIRINRKDIWKAPPDKIFSFFGSVHLLIFAKLAFFLLSLETVCYIGLSRGTP